MYFSAPSAFSAVLERGEKREARNEKGVTAGISVFHCALCVLRGFIHFFVVSKKTGFYTCYPKLSSQPLKASSFEGVLCRFQRHNERHKGRSTRPPASSVLGDVPGLDGRSGLQVIIVSPFLGSVDILVFSSYNCITPSGFQGSWGYTYPGLAPGAINRSTPLGLAATSLFIQ